MMTNVGNTESRDGSTFEERAMSGVVSELPHQNSTEQPEDWTVAAQQVKVGEKNAQRPEDVAKYNQTLASLNADGITPVSAEVAHDVVQAQQRNAAFQQERHTIERDRRLDKTKEKAARQRTFLQWGGSAMAALSILAGYFGIKGNHAEKRPLGNSPLPANEFVVKPNQVNANAEANFNKGNNIEGLDGVTDDKKAAEAAVQAAEQPNDVNANIEKNNEENNDSGLKTENLE